MDKQPDILFREKQKFAAWVHIINYTIFVFVIMTMYITYKTEAAKGNSFDKGDIFPLIIGTGLPVVLEILFVFLKLETEVRNDGLYVRLFPLHIQFKKLTPQDISEAYARKYKPIAEYGGWGIKGTLKNKVYNTQGNEGVQLVFKNGKKLLIGSQKPKELENAINSILRN
jgi:hypothetical protein